MSCNFVVGQKVVCVDDILYTVCGFPHPYGKTGLRKGAIYTVSAVFIEPEADYRGQPHMVVLGLKDVEPHPSWETFKGFNAMRFRPVVTRKTDISIFTDMLDRKKQRAPVSIL